jgi:hypothetical protein
LGEKCRKMEGKRKAKEKRRKVETGKRKVVMITSRLR